VEVKETVPMSLVGSQTLTPMHYTTNVFKISLTGLPAAEVYPMCTTP
jgi:hypothetical protein